MSAGLGASARDEQGHRADDREDDDDPIEQPLVDAPSEGAADERSGELLTQFLSDAVPPGCEIQLIHWQSPSVGERIADWVMPRVVAKGKGTVGEKIIEIARENDIPIQENEVLAGALSNVELGDEIPAELYKAVAEVLIFVMRLTGRLR